MSNERKAKPTVRRVKVVVTYHLDFADDPELYPPELTTPDDRLRYFVNGIGSEYLDEEAKVETRAEFVDRPKATLDDGQPLFNVLVHQHVDMVGGGHDDEGHLTPDFELGDEEEAGAFTLGHIGSFLDSLSYEGVRLLEARIVPAVDWSEED